MPDIDHYVPVRASSVSRHLKDGWWSADVPYPFVSQAGPTMVLIECGRDSQTLGLAAQTLLQHGGYHLTLGGQWLPEHAVDQWENWIEVRKVGDV